MRAVIFILLLGWPFTAWAVDETPKSIMETFFTTVQKGNISAAFDKLFVGTSIPADKPQAVAALKQQTQAGLPLYGKVLGYELLREEKFGESLVRYVYILKSEKAPTIWETYFYRPQAKWLLANIVFNDKFNLLESKK